MGNRRLSAQCIIAADGCVDIVAYREEGLIGFVGMSRADFHHKLELPYHFIGVRMMPGAFHQLTGLPASAAMDNFLPLESIFAD